MRILFLNTNIGYGGASKIMVWVANQCAKNGYEVTFMTYRDRKVLQSLNPSVRLIHEQLESINGKTNFLFTVKWIHKFINKNNFDIGIAFLSPSILRLSIAAKGTGMKVIFSQRGDPYYKNPIKFLKSKVVKWLNRWAFNQADAYVFQTDMAQAYYSTAIQKRSVIIPNPISPIHRTESREGNIHKFFVSIGRLDIKQKRQDLLIEAFNLISQKFPEFILKIYGDGKDEAIVRKLAASNKKIFIMGCTRNVAASVQNAWATVLSSDSEGIPNALLESMSLGVPSISTNCSPGGAAMLIRNKENGILVPRGNVQALAEAMEYMITHPKEAEAMGKAGAAINNLYAEDIVSKKWLTLIESLYDRGKVI